jgi:hypothetical protein
MWQPVGVVVASAIAYGTAAKYRCDVELPSCHAVPSGEPCCTVSSNMGWRYEVIVLGSMTLLIFVLRYFVFTFHESPKFLLGKGKEQEAIDVLHAIAKFNKAPPPTLTIEHFRDIDTEGSAEYKAPMELNTKQSFAVALQKFFGNFKHMKGLFLNKLQLFIFVLLAIAYMVSVSLGY